MPALRASVELDLRDRFSASAAKADGPAGELER